MPVKENPFLKKAAKKPKPNPFIEKAKKSAKPVDPHVLAREAKARKKQEAEAARVAALPREVESLEHRVAELTKRYERSGDEATKLFARLDKLKDTETPRYRELRTQWIETEDMTFRLMATLQGSLTALHTKRSQIVV